MSDRTLTDAPSLAAAHAALHEALADALYRVLTRVLDGDLAGARALLAALTRVFEEHQAFEEEHVMPAYAPLAPADGPGRVDHVAGDHVILTRTLAAAHDALAELTAGGTARAVLERLPTVQRVIATLEHHTLREARVYETIETSATMEPLAKAARAHVAALTERARSA